MAKKIKEIQKIVAKATKQLPEGIEAFAKDKNFNDIDRILPGANYADLRHALKESGIARYKDSIITADFDVDGKVLTMAAAVPRRPIKSEDYLTKSVPDFTQVPLTATANEGLRRQRLALFHEIASKEGIVNNAIKKTAALVSQDGNFKVRTVRQGKRPKTSVVEELNSLLLYWQENVNANSLDAVVTGSRGIKQVIRRGGRQAMIEGDTFLRTIWSKIKVPTLENSSYQLPMNLQALPSADVIVPPDAIGVADLFYWKPVGNVAQGILNPRDPYLKKIVTKLISSKVITELKKNQRVYLDPALLIHIKHGGTDTSLFGTSMVESAMTDLAYGRALKALDFVTIDSLINRMLIVKIGDPNPESDYHNLAVAQQRVGAFRRLLTSDVGPNMMIVWAGHDVDKLDVGAHDALLDTTGRHELARDSTKLSLGVPDSVLIGSVAGGGRGVGWAGFIALAAVAEELREEWTQVITQLGMRIAIENGYQEVDLVWEFNQSLLADREANAKIMLQAYDRGLLSKRTTVEELGKDFDSERYRRSEEQEGEDDALFVPPDLPKGGPGGYQGTAPGSQPGRPVNKGNPRRIGVERPIKDSPPKGG